MQDIADGVRGRALPVDFEEVVQLLPMHLETPRLLSMSATFSFETSEAEPDRVGGGQRRSAVADVSGVAPLSRRRGGSCLAIWSRDMLVPT
jgi:hypothetical protein